MRVIYRKNIRVGSTWEKLSIKLDDAGTVIDLEGATVELRLINAKTRKAHIAAGSGEGFDDGTVEYTLTSDNVNDASVGEYIEEWTVTKDGKTWRGPADIEIRLWILPRL